MSIMLSDVNATINNCLSLKYRILTLKQNPVILIWSDMGQALTSHDPSLSGKSADGYQNNLGLDFMVTNNKKSI